MKKVDKIGLLEVFVLLAAGIWFAYEDFSIVSLVAFGVICFCSGWIALCFQSEIEKKESKE